MLYPYIDEIHITKIKHLRVSISKMSPKHRQSNGAIIDCLIRKDEKVMQQLKQNVSVSMSVYRLKSKIQKVIVLMAKSIRLETTVNFTILKSQIFTLIVVSQENL